MTHFAKIGTLAAAMLLSLQCVAALPDKANLGSENESDWLIARKDGQWKLVAMSPRGRVSKVYPNQEVLRLGEGNSFVEVVSMPPINGDEEIACSPRARRDARDPCSSAFLNCRPDPGNGASSVAMFVFGDTGGASDQRNRLACRADVDAVLRAAQDVGMVRRILPRLDLR